MIFWRRSPSKDFLCSPPRSWRRVLSSGFLLRGLQVRILLGSPLLLMINQIAWRDPYFVLLEERCCAVLQASDSNSNALPATTNSSTQHKRNTAFPASFASDGDTDTIGLAMLHRTIIPLRAAKSPEQETHVAFQRSIDAAGINGRGTHNEAFAFVCAH